MHGNLKVQTKYVKQFVVHDWGTQEEFVTHAYWLQPVAEIPEDLSGEWFNEDLTGQRAEPAGADVRPPGPLSEGLAIFPSLSCDDPDALAAQRTSANIKEQTRRGVNVFKCDSCRISVTKGFVDYMCFQTVLGHTIKDFHDSE